MKNTPKEQAVEIIKVYMPYMYPFGAGSAYLTGDIDNESQLDCAKSCAKYHVESIILSEPTMPNPELSFHYWKTVESFINEVTLEDL